jgi:hypothetical protein
MAFDVPSCLKIFRHKELAGIHTLEFRRFLWYEERTEVICKFLKDCPTVRKVSVLTVLDYNKALPVLFTALTEVTHVTQLHIALNTLSTETISKFVNCVGNMIYL